MPICLTRRVGALRFALAGFVLVLAPAGAEAYTTRETLRTGGWHGAQAKPARVAKRVPAKVQPKTAPAAKTALAAKPAEAAAPVKPAEHNGTWTAGESGGRACFRSRRKLWQADEGWVVKKVNVCP